MNSTCDKSEYTGCKFSPGRGDNRVQIFACNITELDSDFQHTSPFSLAVPGKFQFSGKTEGEEGEVPNGYMPAPNPSVFREGKTQNLLSLKIG
jgi:hypothetical protein